MRPQDETLTRELEWLREFTPATRQAAIALPSLEGERLLVVCHLDLKMVPYFEALLAAGAEVWACAANPATTRDSVAGYLEALGVRVPARASGPPQRHAGLDLTYPVFNWDEVPIKQGLHNRHLVGLMAANTFLDVTGLSLYGKTVLVVGYGPVGRGAADAARHFGAVVEVCDVDPAARLAAAHLGFKTTNLEEGLPRADAVFTATGRDGAIPPGALARCKSGAFLANLGHTNGELPVAGLREHAVASPRPHVERCEVEGRTLYLLAGGAMFNLTAGPGDPYDTFDLVTALMLEATGFLAAEGASYPPGVHLLPKKVQDRAARYLLD